MPTRAVGPRLTENGLRGSRLEELEDPGQPPLVARVFHIESMAFACNVPDAAAEIRAWPAFQRAHLPEPRAVCPCRLDVARHRPGLQVHEPPDAAIRLDHPHNE